LRADVILSLGTQMFFMGTQGDQVQLQISKYNLTYRTNYTAGSLSGPVSVWLAGNMTAQVLPWLLWCHTFYSY
jgi:hypothetical protein